MKNRKTTIDPIEEALRLSYLNANSLDASKELNLIVKRKYSVEISSEKAKQMVNSLFEKLAVDSLGILISKAIETGNFKVEEISTESSLPVMTIEQLQADLILANSIPVISFKNLLKSLQIPFDRAQEAIIKTFHILKNDLAFSPSTVTSMRLAYRRRNTKSSTSFNTKASKAESQYLFQNEEALNKYLKRLDELYKIA
jgi:hypothetical protein